MNEELMNLLANIQALLTEVSQTLGGGQQEAPVQEAEEPKVEDKNNPQVAQKAVVETTNDDVDANASADERLNDDNTETSQKNTEEMAKSILDALSKQIVEKEAKIEKSNNDKVLTDIATAIKAMASNQVAIQNQTKENETAIMNVLKALKIENEVLKIVEPAKPVQKGLNADNDNMEKLIKALTGKKEEDTNTPRERDEYVQKNLRDVNVLKYFTGQL
jgi:hypothetical protein